MRIRSPKPYTLNPTLKPETQNPSEHLNAIRGCCNPEPSTLDLQKEPSKEHLKEPSRKPLKEPFQGSCKGSLKEIHTGSFKGSTGFLRGLHKGSFKGFIKAPLKEP